MAHLKDWLAKRARKDDQLYQQYGKPLEKAHRGEFVAIGPAGKTILGTSDVEVLQKAIETFGSGQFALKRVGQRTFGRWLSFQE